jgi:hypothetical protein
MGGKALNKYGVFTERKNTEEFQALGKEIQDNIELNLPISTAVIKCYHTKETHGDLDLLLCMTDGININWREYIQTHFKPEAIHNNGGVYSFDYKNFQVDFIPIPEAKWESALVYFSYDPCGNCMGKTYHKFGLSYGWEGLFYKYRNVHGTNSSNILLTNDVRKIFQFGGYDYDRYMQGFERLKDIFNFTINSDYFDTEMFQMENLKSIDKKRNRKRGSYHLFLNYLKDNNITISYQFKKDKAEYINIIDACFPNANLLEKIAELKRIDEYNSLLAEKFNGEMVMQWFPKLKGKPLGVAIKNFKDSLGDNYAPIVLAVTSTELRELFMQSYDGRNQYR